MPQTSDRCFRETEEEYVPASSVACRACSSAAFAKPASAIAESWACCTAAEHMPLVVLCGQPCSGKSTVAAMLTVLFEEAQQKVLQVSEETLHLSRREAYQGTESPHLCLGSSLLL